MFQTIGHKSGGFVQISTFGNISRIEAIAHGERKEFRSIPAAKRWLTVQHRKWVEKRTSEHQRFLQSIIS